MKLPVTMNCGVCDQKGQGWDMKNVNRVLVRWIVSGVVIVGAVLGVRGLIVLKERNHEHQVRILKNQRAERQTFHTMMCMSGCFANYLSVNGDLPFPAGEIDLWNFRKTPEDYSPFCDPRDEEGVSALKDGWGREIKIVPGPENMLWMISAGPDGVFQTDFENPYPSKPSNQTPENDDMIQDVPEAPSVLNKKRPTNTSGVL